MSYAFPALICSSAAHASRYGTFRKIRIGRRVRTCCDSRNSKETDPHERTMTQWNKRTRLQPVQFEWEEEPQPRAAQVGDPVRVTVAGVEVEVRIEAVESSTLHVRIGRRLF
jgi:hypothetical protein